MDYEKANRAQLLDRIEELEMLVNELLREREEETKLDFAWTGNLGHWYWNIKTNSVVFNPLKIIAMGYSMEEIPENVTYQFFTDRLHPEDHEPTMEAMRRHMKGEAPVYEVEYRIKTKNGGWKWLKDRGKVTQRDENGKPLFAAGIVFDITKEKQKEEQLEKSNVELKEEAMIDELTGLLNRRAFTGRLQKQFENSMQGSKKLSVGMFDLDKFKNINDTKGHVFGDKVLRETASLIRENLRNMDYAGRYGGEEFIVVFPETAKKDALNAADRIRRAVENHDFGENVKVTISGGIAETPSPDINELIHRADTNLYKAKREGRNRVAI